MSICWTPKPAKSGGQPRYPTRATPTSNPRQKCGSIRTGSTASGISTLGPRRTPRHRLPQRQRSRAGTRPAGCSAADSRRNPQRAMGTADTCMRCAQPQRLAPRWCLASLAMRCASRLVPAPARGGLRPLRVGARGRSTPRVRAPRRHQPGRSIRARWTARAKTRRARPSAPRPVRSRPTRAAHALASSRACPARAASPRMRRASRSARLAVGQPHGPHRGPKKQNTLRSCSQRARDRTPRAEKRGAWFFSRAPIARAARRWCPRPQPNPAASAARSRQMRTAFPHGQRAPVTCYTPRDVMAGTSAVEKF